MIAAAKGMLSSDDTLHANNDATNKQQPASKSALKGDQMRPFFLGQVKKLSGGAPIILVSIALETAEIKLEKCE